ncbi:MAG: nucleotide exchange factor GrpE [Lachnospiraceae bacterium]|nr:nucleotide exchange factor GrpE [Lachnospiraceae bacterium]
MASTEEDVSRKVTIDKLKELEEAAEQQAAEEAQKAGEDAAEAVETEDKPDEAEAAAEGQEEAAAENKEEKPKKGLFGKEKKKDKEKEKLQEQIDELKDKNMRQMAEFENFRKRTEKEKQAMFETGAKSVIEKLLPVVDNFERGLGALKEEEKNAFSEGMQMIYKQMMDELEKLEVKPIEAVGKEFDPNLHNAVMHVDDEEAGDNMVVEELQKGYLYRDTVVRHSMVKVAN